MEASGEKNCKAVPEGRILYTNSSMGQSGEGDCQERVTQGKYERDHFIGIRLSEVTSTS